MTTFFDSETSHLIPKRNPSVFASSSSLTSSSSFSTSSSSGYTLLGSIQKNRKSILISCGFILAVIAGILLLLAILPSNYFSRHGHNSNSNAPDINHQGTMNNNNKLVKFMSKYESSWVQIESVAVKHRPSGWVFQEECDDDTTFTMMIATKLTNIDMLDTLLMDVSDPASKNYGRHYLIEEVRTMFAPSSESVTAIYDWLTYYGLKDSISSESLNSDYIRFPITCAVANQMLNTKYAKWTNTNTGQTHLRIRGSYFIPQSLAAHVDLLSPTLRFPEQSHNKQIMRYFVSDKKSISSAELESRIEQIHAAHNGLKPQHQKDADLILAQLSKHSNSRRRNRGGVAANLKSVDAIASGKGSLSDASASASANADADSDSDSSSSSSDFSYVNPSVLAQLYSMENYVTSAAGTTANKQAIASWLGEYYDSTDLSTFMEYFSVPENTYQNWPQSQDDGYGAEASLDVQYIGSTGRNIYTDVFYTDDSSGHWMLSFLDTLNGLSTTELPSVISMSYGATESSNGEVLLTRANTQIGILSMTGITFLASAGDSGAAGDDGACDSDAYEPSFPASAPYVTAVGGVYSGTFPATAADNTAETAWFYGGGGFSSIWAQPAWQASAVAAFLSASASDAELPSTDLFASAGRAYPDVSAQSVSYVIRYDDSWYTVSGTSASSPTIAGMVSLINDLRLQNGKTPLGFLNPRLYAAYDSNQDKYFNDVSEGHNQGCKTDDYIGFYARQGWDAATGVGTPKFSRLASAWNGLND